MDVFVLKKGSLGAGAAGQPGSKGEPGDRVSIGGGNYCSTKRKKIPLLDGIIIHFCL